LQGKCDRKADRTDHGEQRPDIHFQSREADQDADDQKAAADGPDRKIPQ
jgi:hypothetical protein